MKNSVDLGDRYPPKLKCFIIHSKYFPVLLKVFDHFAQCFSAYQK